MDLDSIWNETRRVLRRQTTQATYDAVYAQSRLKSLVDGGATISVETEVAMEWLEKRLRATVSRALSNVLDRDITPDELAVVVANGSDQATEGEDRPFYVRNRRKTRRYYIDNEFFDWGYAAIVGPIGIAVYNVLCRHADANTQQCYPGKGYIAKQIGLADARPVRPAVRLLEHYNLIHRTERYDVVTRTYNSDLYDLLDISEWKPLPDVNE